MKLGALRSGNSRCGAAHIFDSNRALATVPLALDRQDSLTLIAILAGIKKAREGSAVAFCAMEANSL